MAVNSDDALLCVKDKDVILVDQNTIVSYFNWVITGDASGGSIRFHIRADDTYQDLPKGRHLFIQHLSFITDDVTSYPNNLQVQLLYLRPKLQTEFQVTLGYHSNQAELCTPIQDYTSNPIYCGKTRKLPDGSTPSRIQLTFMPNTNLATYTLKIQCITKLNI